MLTGGCNCGGVRFEVEETALLGAGSCHCTRCQRRTGTAAAITAATEPGSVRVTQGEELIRSWKPDDGFPKLFCGECGSALFSRPPDSPDPRGVRLGTLDGDPGIRPTYHQYVDYAAPWEPIPDDGLERYPEHRSA